MSYASAIYGPLKEVVERYDPKRYAGREPPHRCTVASATAIAQQLPGAPWVFAGELPAGSPLPWPTTEQIAPVTTPMGKKNIPMQVTADGIHMSITCPYTGSEFLFSQLSAAVLGAGSPPDQDDAYMLRVLVGAGAPSPTTSELVAAAQRSLASAQQQYGALVSVSGGVPSSKLTINVDESALVGQIAAQMNTYNTQMTQAAASFVAATKLAQEAVQTIASQNPSAAQYVQRVAANLQMAQGYAQQVAALGAQGATNPNGPANWNNCGPQGSGSLVCGPNAIYLQAANACADVAAQAVGYAQQALATPMPVARSTTTVRHAEPAPHVVTGAGARTKQTSIVRVGAGRSVGAGDSAGRRVGAGAAPPPSFSSLPPDIQAQFAPIAQNLAQEGGGTADPDELYFAQSNFADVLNTLQQGAQIDTGPAVSAAVTFCSLAHTAAGAAQAVDGLLQEGITPGSVQGVVQGFTGTSLGLAGTVVGGAIAIGGTLATAGVGAAIAVGIGVLASIAGSMFSTPPPVAQIGTCGLNYMPTLQIPGAFAWSRDAGVVSSGPSTMSYSAWRRFPNPNAISDAWWYIPGSFFMVASGTQWNGNEWDACIGNGETKRPIDQACYENGQNVFTQLECDANAAVPIAQLPDGGGSSYSAEQVAFARFQVAFFAAWKSNREYDFNGLARQADWQVLMQSVRFWNAAYEPGNGYELALATFAPTSDTQPSGACNTTPYAAMLLGDLQQNGPAALIGYSPTTGRGVLTSAGKLHINTGPKRGAALSIGGVLGGLLGKSVPAKKTSTLAVVGTTVAVVAVAAGGYSLYAYLSGQAQSEAWKRLGRGIWDQGAKSGEHLVAAKPFGSARLLGGAEAAEPKKKSMKVQSLLFPKSEFTSAQARAWARSHNYKAAKVEGQGEYHRIRQFSPTRSTVLRTINFGDSGIRAVVAR
jgi:hypothetical protein